MNLSIKTIFCTGLVVFTSCFPSPEIAGQFTDQEFEEMAKSMATGKVGDIQVSELKNHFGEYILLDTRKKKEYDISHIPGAIWVGYKDFDVSRIKDISKDAKVITYCSVGYRSERIGEELEKNGFTNVQNLEGSIFKWINEGNVIVDKNGDTTLKIHGFNKKWSKWLRTGNVVY